MKTIVAPQLLNFCNIFRSAFVKSNGRYHNTAFTNATIGVREGILLGERKKFALKITICPKNSQFVLKLAF